MEPDTINYMAYYWLMVAASAVLVAALLFVRVRVRQMRQRTVDELRLIFFEGERVSVAAFDYVRAKYEMPTKAERAANEQLAKPVSTLTLLGSAIPYIIICAVGFLMLGMPFDQLMRGTWDVPLVYDSLFWSLAGESQGKAQLRESAAVFGAAFLGGYLMTGRMLLRAVQNYELNQLTFLQAATQLVFGIVSGMMVYHVLRSMGLAFVTSLNDSTVFPAFLLIAFIGGYVPTLGLTVLVQHLRIKVFKTVDRKALEDAKAIPLEVLEGVDYDIAQRLEQSGISDVQILATSNPILLYVETPFGLYCAFDWVLQAQLCASVGSDTFAALKRYNIRTSLDLERAVLADDAPDEFITVLAPIIFPGADQASLTIPAVKHGVMVMLDDLHIHRVRLLWRHIFAQITGGEQAQWLYRKDALLGPVPATAPLTAVVTDAPDPPVIVAITDPAVPPSGHRPAEEKLKR